MKINASKNPIIRFHPFLLWMLTASFCSIMFSACKQDPKRMEAKQVVKEWMGKEVRFPDNVPCSALGKDTTKLCEGLFDSEYKVLLYVDSTGCSSCRLRLFEWKHLIEEADSLFPGKLNFLLYFQPKEGNSRDLAFLFQRDHFDYPVFLDVNNRLDSLNRFPKVTEFQCFLLDKNNRVLLIGNPLLNPKIWDLFKKQISGEKQAANVSHTTVETKNAVYDFGTVKKGVKNEVVFFVKNTANQPMVLYQVSASCGCTKVEWDKQPVRSGNAAKIKVEVTPDEIGYFSKTLDVYVNMNPSMLTLRITGAVVE